jgi:hypothetical protein
VTGLTDAERQQLEQVVARRVGVRSDPKQLVAAYLDAMVRNAYERTTDDAPVPTSLTSERSLILIEISRQLNRVIEDFEIQALFRVPLTSARTMRTTLLATYTDDADQLTMAWSLRGARTEGRRKESSFTGTVVVFDSQDRRDAFVENVQRSGVDIDVVLGDDAKPWQVIVGDAFPKNQLPAGK